MGWKINIKKVFYKGLAIGFATGYMIWLSQGIMNWFILFNCFFIMGTILRRYNWGVLQLWTMKDENIIKERCSNCGKWNEYSFDEFIDRETTLCNECLRPLSVCRWLK